MSMLGSRREKRLWLALMVVIAAIYATLGQVPATAAFMRERNDLRDVMFLVLFIMTTGIAIILLRSGPRLAEIAVGVGTFAIYMTACIRISTLEERTRLFEYGLVAALVHEALIERANNGRHVPFPALLALGISFVLGWIDEGIQLVLPNRVFDLRDVVFNSFAALMVIGARWILIHVR